MSKINAEIIAHNKNEFGDELITFVVTFPRIILAEFNTHRMFSRNSASSRAIPFNKMVESIKNNPFIPIAWQEEHKGMQGTKYLTGTDAMAAEHAWKIGAESAILRAEELNYLGATKQLCNRILEPYMWHTVIITTGKEGLENFFNLRCPQYEYKIGNKTMYSKSWKDYVKVGFELDMATEEDYSRDYLWKAQFNKGQAEIHMMALAEAMWDAYNENIPELLKAGEWHIPYKNQIIDLFGALGMLQLNTLAVPDIAWISSVMCARVSYTVAGHDLTEWTYKKYIDKSWELANATPLHASPFEHCAVTMNEEEYYTDERGIGLSDNKVGRCRNFKGFIQLRHIIEQNKQKQ